MPMLLELHDAVKQYGGQILLDEASFTLTDSVKMGMVGRNGTGKTTLCRILMDREELDKGEIVRHPDLRPGFLEQHDPFLPGETVLSFLLRDSGAPEWRCGEVAGRFEIKGDHLHLPVTELSGGWQTRIKLAALLLHEPNLLILDEPTNFLDLRTQFLLETFLRDFKGACLIVSHDRGFLRATCTHTLELSRGKLKAFSGNVDAWLNHCQKLHDHNVRANTAIIARQRQLQRFIDKNRASPKTSSQAKSKAKQLDRLKLHEIEAAESTARIHLPDIPPRKGTVLRCADLAVGYPDLTVARGIELDIDHGSRVAIVGDNGQGKTTLLRTLAGSLPPREGEVRLGFGCSMGYYAQLVYSDLPAHPTVLEYLESRTTVRTTTDMIRGIAGAFLFRGDEIYKPISVLSGGERARLCLAGLLLGAHNILILDEPGNHLDVETVDVLADALEAYPGTLIFTGHDRHFLERVATQVLEVRDGRVKSVHGGYAAYADLVVDEIEAGLRLLGSGPRPKEKMPVRDSKEQARERYRLTKEAQTLERRITRLETERDAATARYRGESDALESRRLHEEIDRISREIETVEEEWLGVQDALESI